MNDDELTPGSARKVFYVWRDAYQTEEDAKGLIAASASDAAERYARADWGAFSQVPEHNRPLTCYVWVRAKNEEPILIEVRADVSVKYTSKVLT